MYNQYFQHITHGVVLVFPTRLHGIRTKCHIHSLLLYHLFTHAGNSILHKSFPVLVSDELFVSHAVDFIYSKTASRRCSTLFCPSCRHMLFCSGESLEMLDIVSLPNLSRKCPLDNELYTPPLHSPHRPLLPSLTPPVTPDQQFSRC